jgi:DNA-binding NtrC family response regulator
MVTLSAGDKQGFIKAPPMEELFQALKGETSELHLQADIQLEAALRALKDGSSLTDIIQQTVWQLEKYIIVQTLKSTHGNKAETARLLKIDYKTLYRKMDRYFDTPPDFTTATDSNEQPSLPALSNERILPQPEPHPGLPPLEDPC